MKREEVVLDEALEVSPPGDALRALVRGGAAVELRHPLRQLAWMLLAWAALACIAIAIIGVRRDLVALPVDRFAMVTAMWFTLVAASTILALRPVRGQVLPSLPRARLAVLLTPLVGLVLAVELLVDARGVTTIPDAAKLPHSIVHCLTIAIAILAPALVGAWWTLRRLAPVGATWIGAAIGACAGALSALVLHVVCPIGGAMHVGLGHAGGLVIGAALGAIVGALSEVASSSSHRAPR